MSLYWAIKFFHLSLDLWLCECDYMLGSVFFLFDAHAHGRRNMFLSAILHWDTPINPEDWWALERVRWPVRLQIFLSPNHTTMHLCKLVHTYLSAYTHHFLRLTSLLSAIIFSSSAYTLLFSLFVPEVYVVQISSIFDKAMTDCNLPWCLFSVSAF